MPLTPTQVNRVLEAQATRPELAELNPEGVAARLTQEGDAAFAPAGLALAEEGGLAKVGGFVPRGTEGLDETDIQVPRLKIRMAGTENADAVPLGNWFNSVDTENQAGTIVFVPVKVRPFLRYGSPHPSADKDKKRNELAKAQGYGLSVDADHKSAYCYSKDRETPEGSDSGVVSPVCSGCPARKAFDCRPGYELLVLDLTDYGGGPVLEPALLTITGHAVRRWKSTQSLLMARCRRGRANLSDFKVAATTVKDGTYYLPKFGKPEPQSDKAIAELLDDIYEVYA